jgi:hypothetical protein
MSRSALSAAAKRRRRAVLAMFGSAFGDISTHTARQPDDADLEALLKRDTFVAMSPERGEAMLFLRERSAFADTAATDEVAE